jgi:flavin reductase (DIM6/NTAB) family NADH-FMN oxidoreductase RutF
VIFDPAVLDRRTIYHLMCQTIIPRPIAWVLTPNGTETGPWNLAPFSFFNGVATEPPLVGFSIGHDLDSAVPREQEIRRKDTLTNLRRDGRCVVNLPRSTAHEQVTASARPLAHGDSETDAFDIELTSVPGWPLPRVASSPVAFMGQLHDEIEVSRGDRQLFVLVRLERIWIDDAAVASSSQNRTVIDPVRVDPLGRLGAGTYVRLGEVISGR